MIAGFIIGPFEKGSIFHPIHWHSHLSKRSVKSSASAETLAAGEAVEEGILLNRVYQMLFKNQFNLSLGVNSKDLFQPIYTCRIPQDKSIFADVQFLRYYFGTKSFNKNFRLPGCANPADAATKKDSLMCDAQMNMLLDGTIEIDLSKIVIKDCNPQFG